MNTRRLALLCICFVGCSNEPAPVWESLGLTGNGTTELLVSTSSIRFQGDIVRVESKLFDKPGTEQRWEEYPGQLISYSVAQTSYDCARGLRRDEDMALYFTDGTSRFSNPADFSAKWTAVDASPIAQRVMKFACAKRK